MQRQNYKTESAMSHTATQPHSHTATQKNGLSYHKS